MVSPAISGIVWLSKTTSWKVGWEYRPMVGETSQEWCQTSDLAGTSSRPSGDLSSDDVKAPPCQRCRVREAEAWWDHTHVETCLTCHPCSLPGCWVRDAQRGSVQRRREAPPRIPAESMSRKVDGPSNRSGSQPSMGCARGINP